jgi:hypothetical protein
LLRCKIKYPAQSRSSVGDGQLDCFRLSFIHLTISRPSKQAVLEWGTENQSCFLTRDRSPLSDREIGSLRSETQTCGTPFKGTTSDRLAIQVIGTRPVRVGLAVPFGRRQKAHWLVCAAQERNRDLSGPRLSSISALILHGKSPSVQPLQISIHRRIIIWKQGLRSS